MKIFGLEATRGLGERIAAQLGTEAGNGAPGVARQPIAMPRRVVSPATTNWRQWVIRRAYCWAPPRAGPLGTTRMWRLWRSPRAVWSMLEGQCVAWSSWSLRRMCCRDSAQPWWQED